MNRRDQDQVAMDINLSVCQCEVRCMESMEAFFADSIWRSTHTRTRTHPCSQAPPSVADDDDASEEVVNIRLNLLDWSCSPPRTPYHSRTIEHRVAYVSLAPDDARSIHQASSSPGRVEGMMGGEDAFSIFDSTHLLR